MSKVKIAICGIPGTGTNETFTQMKLLCKDEPNITFVDAPDLTKKVHAKDVVLGDQYLQPSDTTENLKLLCLLRTLRELFRRQKILENRTEIVFYETDIAEVKTMISANQEIEALTESEAYQLTQLLQTMRLFIKPPELAFELYCNDSSRIRRLCNTDSTFEFCTFEYLIAQRKHQDCTNLPFYTKSLETSSITARKNALDILYNLSNFLQFIG